MAPDTVEKASSQALGREARITVLTLLKHFYDEETFNRLVKEMYDSDPAVSEAAIRASASLGNEIAVPHLYQIIERGRDEQRLAAVQALAAIRAPSTTDMLVKYFNHYPEETLRTEILRAINLIAPTSPQVQELDHAVLLDPRQGEVAKRIAIEALVEGERRELLGELLPKASPAVQEAAFTRMLQSAWQEVPNFTRERLSPAALGSYLCLLAVKSKAAQQSEILELLQRSPRQTLVSFLGRLSAFQGHLRHPTRVFRLLLVLPFSDPETEGLLGDFLRRIVAEVKSASPHLLSEFSVIASAHLETIFAKIRKNYLSLRGIASKDELLATVFAGLVERYASAPLLAEVQSHFRDEPGGRPTVIGRLHTLVASGPREDQNRFEACLPLFALEERKDRLIVSNALARVDLGRPLTLRRLNRLIRIAGVLEIRTASRRIQEILEFARSERIAYLEQSAIVTLCQLLTRAVIEQSRDCFRDPGRAPHSLLGYVRGARWMPPRIMIGPLVHLLLQPKVGAELRRLAIESLEAMNLAEVARSLPPLLKSLDMEALADEDRLRVADILGRNGDAALAHQALDLASSRSPATRRAAVRVLRGLAARGAGVSADVLTNRLYMLLDDRDRGVRLEALLGLLALDDDYATQVANDQAAAGDAKLASELLKGIGRPLSREAFALARGLLRVESAPVQEALRSLGPELCQGSFAEETRQALLEALAGAAAPPSAPPRLAPVPQEGPVPARAGGALGRAKLEFKFKRENTQVLTVFFSDIAGYTEKTSAMDMSAVLALIKAFEEILASAITANRGTVVKKMGDAILAAFRHPVNAVIAAMTVQQKIQQYNSMRVDQEKFHVRIGLNTGPVIRKDNDVFGEVVNVASRMQSVASPGDILLTEGTFAEIRDYVRCTELGPIQVKGIKEAITTYSPEEVLVDLTGLREAGAAEGGRARSGSLERLRESMFVPDFKLPSEKAERGFVHLLREVFSEIARAVEDIAPDYHQEYSFKRWLQDRWNEIAKHL